MALTEKNLVQSLTAVVLTFVVFWIRRGGEVCVVVTSDIATSISWQPSVDQLVSFCEGVTQHIQVHRLSQNASKRSEASVLLRSSPIRFLQADPQPSTSLHFADKTRTSLTTFERTTETLSSEPKTPNLQMAQPENQKMSQLLVFGGTGRCGQGFVKRALVSSLVVALLPLWSVYSFTRKIVIPSALSFHSISF